MALSDYDKMIIENALAYGFCGVIKLKETEIFDLAQNLKIEGELLLDAMNFDSMPIELNCVEYKGDRYNTNPVYSPLFDAVIRYYLIQKDLGLIVDKSDEKTVVENIKFFFDAVDHFETMNANSDICEAERTGQYTHQYLMYDGEGYRPKEILDLLMTYNTARDCMGSSNALDGHIRIAQMILKHELLSRANAIYLAVVAQVISHSPQMNTEIRLIAQEFYLNIISKLRNAKVLSVQVNLLYQDTKKACSARTREEDNTTRLKIIYGFDNFDAYSMRLDLAHQGEGFIHYNNQSPGKVKCCLFSKEEYDAIIRNNFALSDCFISYGERFALKERGQIKQSMRADYEVIREQNEHKKAFVQDYSEENVIDFVNNLGKMLPQSCLTVIKTDRKHDSYMFDLNRYYMMVTILFLALVSNSKDAEKMYNYIVEKMINKGVITSDFREYFTNLGDVCDFAELLRSRAEESSLDM